MNLNNLNLFFYIKSLDLSTITIEKKFNNGKILQI